MLLEELAKDLVEVTSSLIGGRTINVMNTEGIIVASTEGERVGSYHRGAREAVQTGKVVNIRKDQLSQYPGAKEGCNMPLRVNGTVIGVVGIYGDPDEIRDVAHLLEVYAAKYYQMEAMLRPRLSEAALRCQLLEALLSPPKDSLSTVYSLMDRLHLRLTFPVTTAVISEPRDLSLPGCGDALCQRLEQLDFLDPRTDIWGIVEQRMVLLAGAKPNRTLQALRTLPEDGYRVSLGTPSASLWEIHQAYRQADILDRSGGGWMQDIADTQTRCQYMLSSTALEQAAFLDTLAKQLRETFSPQELRVLMDSIQCYYDCGRSVTAAAQKQFVHKNTLQYRVKRVLDSLGIGQIPAFWQEYLVRLVLQRLHEYEV